MRIILAFIISFLFIQSSFAYDTQWFESYKDLNFVSQYNCESLCFIGLGDFKDNDIIKIKWNISWTWVVWIWLYVWWKVSELNSFKISWNNKILEEYTLIDKSFYHQIPINTELVLFLSGNLKSHDSVFLWEKVWFFWKLFMWINSNEWLTPYSINLRFWSKIFWTSITKILYILFFIIVWVLFVSKKLNKNNLLYLILTLFLIVSFKNLYDYWRIYFWWVNDFYFAEENKSFHNLWDYYDFTSKARKSMWIDIKSKKWENECSYYAECSQDWPFCYHWRTAFLKPCKNVKEVDDADFILLYKKDIPKDFTNKTIIHSQNNSYLIKK